MDPRKATAGAVAGFLLIVVAAALYWPMSAAYHSVTSATQPNPPRTAPVDPYGYAGIANGSGGRGTLTSYGAGAPGIYDGASEVYGILQLQEAVLRVAKADFDVYLVPAPIAQLKTSDYLASPYLDKDENVLAWGPIGPELREPAPTSLDTAIEPAGH